MPDFDNQSIDVVLRAYGLKDAEITPAATNNNRVFKVVAAQQSYALRLHRPGHKRRAWIQSELIWLGDLRRDTALNVPEPVRTENGDWLVEADGVFSSLLRWQDGDFLTSATISIEQVRAAGTFLGHLHRYATAYVPPPDFERPRLDAEGLFGENSPYNPGENARIFTAEQNAIFAQVEDRVRKAMDALDQSANTFGLIHADFLLKNMLFNGDAVSAIDFDDCAWGYYVYDLAPLLLQFKSEPRYADLSAALWAGYTAARPQPEAFRAHLETFVAARVLASCRWLAGNLDNPTVKERAPGLIVQRTAELNDYLQTGVMRPNHQLL